MVAVAVARPPLPRSRPPRPFASPLTPRKRKTMCVRKTMCFFLHEPLAAARDAAGSPRLVSRRPLPSSASLPHLRPFSLGPSCAAFFPLHARRSSAPLSPEAAEAALTGAEAAVGGIRKFLAAPAKKTTPDCAASGDAAPPTTPAAATVDAAASKRDAAAAAKRASAEAKLGSFVAAAAAAEERVAALRQATPEHAARERARAALDALEGEARGRRNGARQGRACREA